MSLQRGMGFLPWMQSLEPGKKVMQKREGGAAAGEGEKNLFLKVNSIKVRVESYTFKTAYLKNHPCRQVIKVGEYFPDLRQLSLLVRSEEGTHKELADMEHVGEEEEHIWGLNIRDVWRRRRWWSRSISNHDAADDDSKE